MKRLALTAALIAGFVVVPSLPAQASACAGTDGVTVIVDFGAFGGGVSVQCAAGTPSSGIDALHKAGFSTAGTVDDGSAFVCRINSQPSPETEACASTPPAVKSWSYWHAERGGSWVYCKTGAAGYKPPPGSVEGWAFGSGAKPSVSPPAAPAPPAPVPATTAARPVQTTAVADPAVPASSIVDSPSPLASSALPPSGSASAAAVAESSLPRNDFTGTFVAVGLVLLLTIAAVVIHRRRSRRTPAE